jgi:hypothetical protein
LNRYHQDFEKSSPPEIEMLLAFDQQHDQYLWFQVGWASGERIKGNSVHIQLKNEKIYIEEDWTEEGIATALMTAGVPREDIVLAFHEPKMRQYTDFAVA